jgi:hypothetical protein
MSSLNATDLLKPLVDEVKGIDPKWVALEAISDLLCLLMALYLLMPGVQKLLPSHPKYPDKQRIFIWLSSTWGVPNYPRLFQFVVGLVETSVAVACFACFLPGPTAQLITIMALILSINLCTVFFITLVKEPWGKKGLALRQLLQGAIALWIRLSQDFDWKDSDAVFYIYAWTAAIALGSLFMLYRRFRYGRAPDPLLGAR